MRRTPSEAKRLILEAAEDLLRSGGTGAVQVRAVAARLDITDAAINHHFGTRDQLLTTLLRHVGRRLKQQIQGIVDAWDDHADITQLVDALADTYADGYADLAVALHQSGWRDSGSGMLGTVVDALHERAIASADRSGRPPPARETFQVAVASLHQALATEPIYGHEFRRSAGLAGTVQEGAAITRRWWTETLQGMLD